MARIDEPGYDCMIDAESEVHHSALILERKSNTVIGINAHEYESVPEYVTIDIYVDGLLQYTHDVDLSLEVE